MTNIPGMIRPEIQMLPQVADRLTFLYRFCTGSSNQCDYAGTWNKDYSSGNGVNRRRWGHSDMGGRTWGALLRIGPPTYPPCSFIAETGRISR